MKFKNLKSITTQKSHSIKGNIDVYREIIKLINSLFYFLWNAEMTIEKAYELYAGRYKSLELENNHCRVNDDVAKCAIKSTVSDIKNLIAYSWFLRLYNFAIRKYPDYAAKHADELNPFINETEKNLEAALLYVVASGKNSDVDGFIKEVSDFLISRGHLTIGVEIEMSLEIISAQLNVFINKLVKDRPDLDLGELKIANAISKHITSFIKEPGTGFPYKLMSVFHNEPQKHINRGSVLKYNIT